MGNASAPKRDGAMGWANENPVSARTAALLEAWRTRPAPVGNELDRLYAVMVHGYDRRAAEEAW